MHGAGNDFVVIDERVRPLGLSVEQVRRLADRRVGIGCDQFITLHPRPAGTDADVVMRIRNPDGSEAGACGNATRCVAELLFEQTGHPFQVIRTVAGDLPAERLGDGRFRVDMGAARLGWAEVPLARACDTLRVPMRLESGELAAGSELGEPAACSMGNPHATFFVADVAVAGVRGPALEVDPWFPERANIGFAAVVDAGRMRLRVWERGAGLTLACGSGACAAAVNAHQAGAGGAPGGGGDGWGGVGNRVSGGWARADGGAGVDEFSGGGGAAMTEVITFGCRLNAVESEAMAGLAAGL